ncbi:MAG: hypothetical protein J6J36_04100 [Clostridia bacterium]|nr:hypothetical protein [Clostridia bacterium]
MYICPACGAGLAFNPKSQMLECAYCNSKFKPEEVEDTQYKMAKGQKEKKIDNITDNEVYDVISYRCTQCGAELMTTEETLATFCSYCGSSAVLQKNSKKNKKPDYIIPFEKSKEECEKAYKRMLQRAFFAPSDMSKSQQVEKIRGIYMPYWVYSYEKKGLQKDNGSRRSRRVGDYVYYKDYEISTNLDAVCDGVVHDASANFSDTLSEAIGPFSISKRKDFSPTYLSGFYADSEDVNNDTYVAQCREIAGKRTSKELAKDSTYSRYNAHPNVFMDMTKAEMGLFPVYFLATRNRKGDRISYAVVNGQTGKVAAEIPIDFTKFILSSAVLSVAIFIILNLLFTITPGKVLGLSILFSIISLIVSYKQVGEIYARENKLNDKGVLAKENAKVEDNQAKTQILKNIKIKKNLANKANKMPFGERIKKIYKPLISIIVAIIIFMANPASDVVYYIGAIVSIITTIWSFFGLIKEINLLTTRKLPHLEARGGDENA